MTPAGVATVARQEFRLRLRAGRWRVLLAVWFVVLLGFMLLLRAAVGSASSGQVVDKGIVLYGGLAVFVLGLALLVVPALAAQSVNGDRERGTLATLQVSRLTAGEIALGKFAAAWGTSLVFLALTLPLVGYAMTQGGVPLGRVLVETLVLAVLLGTVCALSLLLSALLARTTTSGVLSYLVVFGLTVGTLIVFGLVTAATSETVQGSYTEQCPTPAELPPNLPPDKRDAVLACRPGPRNYTTTRTRTDRTWWLLAPNPFVVLADAAPQLAPLTAAELARRQADEQRGVFRQDARDLDPLGQIGRAVRTLRRLPEPPGQVLSARARDPRRPVWPTGLAIDLALGAGALVLTSRRLRTPSRSLPKGQRIA